MPFEQIAHIEAVAPSLFDLDEVHIWKVDLKDCPEDAPDYLKPADTERYQRIIPPRQKQRFLASRYWLRRIISSYLGIPMRELVFINGDHGKPSLELSDTQLEFNLSHTGDVAVLAVANGTPVGIDLERLRLPIDVMRTGLDAAGDPQPGLVVPQALPEVLVGEHPGVHPLARHREEPRRPPAPVRRFLRDRSAQLVLHGRTGCGRCDSRSLRVWGWGSMPA